MSNQYNQAVAAHYAAYRPPLHQPILEKVLDGSESFDDGLDVGCGTGYSAVALARYCQRVYGVEPSRPMLDRALPNNRITYLEGDGERMPLAANSVDIVTFAGALFYAKTHNLVTELKRVCRSKALVIPYDFNVLLDDVLRPFAIAGRRTSAEYDPAVNFSDMADFVELSVENTQIQFEVTASELAHILLSNNHRYETFSEKYNTSDPFPTLVRALGSAPKLPAVSANIYFSKYWLKC